MELIGHAKCAGLALVSAVWGLTGFCGRTVRIVMLLIYFSVRLQMASCWNVDSLGWGRGGQDIWCGREGGLRTVYE